MNESDLSCHTKAAMRITHAAHTIMHINLKAYTHTHILHFIMAETEVLPKCTFKSGTKKKATKYPHIRKQIGKAYSVHQ